MLTPASVTYSIQVPPTIRSFPSGPIGPSLKVKPSAGADMFLASHHKILPSVEVVTNSLLVLLVSQTRSETGSQWLLSARLKLGLFMEGFLSLSLRSQTPGIWKGKHYSYQQYRYSNHLQFDQDFYGWRICRSMERQTWACWMAHLDCSDPRHMTKVQNLA